ncbi:MAG TPA: protein-tyrosine-phosphatase [Flavobacteriaceae bacterium]|nr:protein-tyrosine-phosphatase [Flavobacteriaceae bacterium]
MAVFDEIKKFISTLNVESIPDERKELLFPLIDFIQNKIAKNEPIRINFICTHNSRRSHFSQVWAQSLAYYFNLKNVFCYSGGTEATAFFSKVAKTLSGSGFEIQTLSSGKNPVYSIKFSENEASVIGFSKTYDNDFNPKSNFVAVMTCSQADANCPFVAGAEKRIPIPFDDPKKFDNTPQQVEKYNEINRQIATELFYVFNQIDLKN